MMHNIANNGILLTFNIDAVILNLYENLGVNALPTIDSSTIFENVRARISLMYNEMLSFTELDNNTERRNRNRTNAPRKETRDKILSVSPEINDMIRIPVRAEQMNLCERITQALLNNEPHDDIHELINKALSITGITANDYVGKTLIAQEPEILHSLAKLYAKEGELDKAIEVLQNVLSIVELYPPDIKHKDLQISELLLTLSGLMLQASDVLGATEACDLGLDITIKWDQGKFSPDFIFTKALLDTPNNPTHINMQMYLMAYAGYIALGKSEEASKVMSLAKGKYGSKIKTYGMDTIESKKYYYSTKAVDHIQFTNLGQVLSHFHLQSGLTSREIYTGICDKHMFSRLKMDKIKTPNIFIIEALMQRMGRDINKYYNLIAPPKEFDLLQLRDFILFYNRTSDIDSAVAALKKFADVESTIRYENNVLMQFIEAANATIYGKTHGRNLEYYNKLTKGLMFTIPSFDDNNLQRYPLTIREAVILQQMALYHEATGDVQKAICIYADLLSSLSTYWKDIDLLSSMYTTISFNYSSCLGRADKRCEALAVIERGLEFGTNCGDLAGICNLYFNKAYNLLHLHNKDESFPFFMLSYFGSMIFLNHGAAYDVQITRELIQKNFDVFL